jgi:carboxypeptidase Taq
MEKGHSMTDSLHRLKARLGEFADLQHAAAVLEWDHQTYMPPAAAQERGEQVATLSKLAHHILTADATGQLIEAARNELDHADPDGDDARLLQTAQRDYDRASKVPPELVAEIARTTAVAHEAWVKARASKDFKVFHPHLEKILDLKRQVAACFGPQASLYDPLLDEYEPGMKAAHVREVFDDLKRQLIPLVHAIAARPETDDTVLRQDFDEQKQWDFGVEVIKRFGYDFSRGRQDKVVHPFCVTMGIDDVRVTTRLHRNYLPTALMGTMHECGHGLYEQGFHRDFARTPLASATSLGIHESQSRMWENLVGRSRGFWKHFYPQLQSVFPEQLGQVAPESFYKAINKVKPSFVRVEADEVTYNLHILLRFEMEADMLEGRLEVNDAPAAWNAKFKDYFGLDVPDDSLGILQDAHWSAGLIGYFPTYTLGNLASVQFFEKAVADVPSIPAEVERGEFGGLLGWLRESIHRHGRKFLPGELIERVTGSPLNSSHYIAYLRRKYSEIYDL